MDQTHDWISCGVQGSLDFATSDKRASTPRFEAATLKPAHAVRFARDMVSDAIDLTPEPPFSIAADHFRALKKKTRN